MEVNSKYMEGVPLTSRSRCEKTSLSRYLETRTVGHHSNTSSNQGLYIEEGMMARSSSKKAGTQTYRSNDVH
jgi:hypothetical protein